MKPRYFGTDGIRGPFGGDLINRDLVLRLAAAMVGRLTPSDSPTRLTIAVGRDTRADGATLADWLAEGFSPYPVQLLDLGILSTPAIAWNTRQTGAHLGIALTASHNPASDNGIKLFTAAGSKLTPAEELAIEEAMDALPSLPTALSPAGFTRVPCPEGLENYLQSVGQAFAGLDLTGWKIACDSAHGATFQTTPRLLRQMGAEVFALGDRPDGTNINAGCGSEHPERLADLVRSSGAHLGIAHDGDGDRVIFVDHTGEVVPGDQVLGLLALDGIARQTLPSNLMVVTHQSNLGLDFTIAGAGGKILRAEIGDRNVALLMAESGATLGGESSGHIILHDLNPTGDGLLAALALLRFLRDNPEPLARLRQRIQLFPQVTANLRVAVKRSLPECSHLEAACQTARQTLGSSGRVMVRYSGTEPKLRFLIEAPTDAQANNLLGDILAAAARDLTVEEA